MTAMHIVLDAAPALRILRGFVSMQQLRVLAEACEGEEREFFIGKVIEMAALVSSMPKTYGQDGKGDQAIAYLHYFMGGADWYITEADSDEDQEGQHQAFGWADLGHGCGELGYISIVELIRLNVEIDLHYTPQTLAEIKAAK